MREAHGIGDGPGAGHAPRHKLGVPDARWHSMSLAGGGTYGAPDGGTLEQERLWPQGQALLTPLAMGGGIWTDAAVGGRALNTPKPPAVAGLHRHEPRRGPASLPQRTAGGRRGGRGRSLWRQLRRLGWHGPRAMGAGEPRRARAVASSRARLAARGGRAPPQGVRGSQRNRRDQARRQGPSPYKSNLNQAGQPPGPTTSFTTTSAAGARGLPARPPGDDGAPAANPVHQPPSGRANWPHAACTNPEQSAPHPSAAAYTAGRKTGGPLHGAAAPGGGGRPQADPAERLPQPSGSNAIHTDTRPATYGRTVAWRPLFPSFLLEERYF